MSVPERVLNITAPPIELLNTRMAELTAGGADVISLGQSVPWFAPPPEIREAVAESLQSTQIDVYSDVIGLPELRDAVSRKLADFNDIAADPATNIIITPGSNQAFIMALLTLVEPGDEVLLPAPHFFNHDMAISLCGARAVEVPLDEEEGFQLRLQNVEPLITAKTKAMLINSPNNPTGAVYRKEELVKLVGFLAERGIYVISDEAYEVYCFDGAEHFSPASAVDTAERVITLGSFSKTFGMTGWRVGYFVADAEICRQAVKVQDSMAICAPVVSQFAALAALRQTSRFVADHVSELARRRALLIERLDAVDGLSWRPTDGSMFALLRTDVGRDSWDLMYDILNEAHVLVIPGASFGRSGEGFLRVSYGSSERERLAEALDRLEHYFRSRG